MLVLVVNAGSSSLKLDVLDSESGQRRGRCRVERIGEASSLLRSGDEPERRVECAHHRAALELALPPLLEAHPELEAVAHRVVHGGDRFRAATLIDDGVEAEIDALAGLAPLHNPINLEGIRAARRALPSLPHVAVFDTAFHATLPARARSYALPARWNEAHGLRRYGFHGTSHAWVAHRAAGYLGEALERLRLVTCHLGGGASASAVEYGRSVETSMGMTPLEGLVMGTRSGDLDPGVLVLVAEREGLSASQLDEVLNRESGLAGLTGSADMRDIEERAAGGDEASRLAIQVYAHRVRKYIGAYAAVMGGVDAIVFTAGIGENSALIRQRVTQRLDFLGARLDEDRNRDAKVDPTNPVAEVSAEGSRTRILVVASDEAHALARVAARLVGGEERVEEALTLPVAISARHVHLTQEAVEALFGAGSELEADKSLSQPGQFAAVQRVDLIGPKRNLENVRIVGPVRDRCQVEISRSDEFHLGIDAPVRRSGDLDNTPGITIEGPAGRVTIESGVICAQRHIHMTPEDAEHFGVAHRDVVDVALDTDGRDLVFGDVVVRVKDSYRLEMHVDTDEGNAAEISRGEVGVLQATGCRARLTRRSPGL